MKTNLYNMKFHEKLIFEADGTEVQRVPGGWIYTRFQVFQTMQPDGYWSENYLPTSVFVPLNLEFVEAK